jgi:hypothetical protein
MTEISDLTEAERGAFFAIGEIPGVSTEILVAEFGHEALEGLVAKGMIEPDDGDLWEDIFSCNPWTYDALVAEGIFAPCGTHEGKPYARPTVRAIQDPEEGFPPNGIYVRDPDHDADRRP